LSLDLLDLAVRKMNYAALRRNRTFTHCSSDVEAETATWTDLAEAPEGRTARNARRLNEDGGLVSLPQTQNG
jgi:hypothetical protein